MNDLTSVSPNYYRRLLAYAAHYKRYFLISFFGFVLFASMQTLLFSAVELFINLLSGKPTRWADKLPFDFNDSIYLLPIFVLILSFFRGVGNYFGQFYISKVGLNVINMLRKEVFNKLMYLPQNYFDKNNSGEQISLIIYNIDQVSLSITRAIKILLEQGLLLVGSLIFLFIVNWKLTLLFFTVTPILAALVFIAARYFRRVSKIIQKTVGRVSHITNEAVQGIHTVKSYSAEGFESQRFKDAADENLKYSTKFERVNALQTPIMQFVIAAALAMIFLLVLLVWPDGEVGTAVAFMAVAGSTAKPIKQLSTINSMIQKGLAAAETIFSVLDESNDLDEGQKELNNIAGHIQLDNVQFSYESGKPVLNTLSLDIPPGKTLALVGQSGSGKSTIAGLLLRLYNADAGSIKIDNCEIREIKLSSLRDNIAFVSQNATLFDASIRDNVRYGSCKNAPDPDDERLITALHNANAYDFVMALDQGLDTLVGESGGRLSGGQRQRIAIARALYKDAPILILDEATSALDNNSEKLIQEALDRLKQGRTTLIIAHRLSTIRDANKIVVLSHGDIMEMGSHSALLEKNGHYAELVRSQSAEG